MKTCPVCNTSKHPSAFSAVKNICNLCHLDGKTYTPPEKVRKPTEAEILQAELAARTLARRRLIHFVQRFKPDYQAGWVHHDICRRLEQFVKDVEAKKSPRLLLCMPPRAGKSELTSRNFPAWALGHHPEWEIIAASHTQSLALSFSRHLRDKIRDPAYEAVFQDCVLDPQSQSVENWMTTAGGGYMAAGVGTGITGRGAHVLIIDDPVKDMEAADSQLIRDNTWEWYTSTAYTRIAPGGGVLGIMTLWNDDDWGGRTITYSENGEGDRFEIVRYPAINEGYDEYQDNETFSIVKKYPADPIPDNATLIRKADSALHPDRYDTEMLLKIKRNLYASGQQRVWSALYQQNPAPEEGAYFTKDLFRYYSTPPRRRGNFIYQAWDFAIAEGQENDYTVGATILQDERDALHVLDVKRFKSADSIYIVDVILDYAAEFDADLLGFEDGQIWKTMQAQFDKRCEERRMYPTYEILKPLTDKKARANPLKGRMQAGKVYFDAKAPWFHDTYTELLRFPAGKHDDVVDALAWAVRLTLTRSAPKVKEPDRIKSWKDKLSTGGSLGDVSHMAA